MNDRAHVVQIDVEGWFASCAKEVLGRVVADGDGSWCVSGMMSV